MISLYFDGSYDFRTGACKGGYVVKDEDGRTIWQGSEDLGCSMNHSCNVGEYAGLAAGLEWLRSRLLLQEPIKIYGDSQLVIMQMTGEWKIKKGKYIPQLRRACKAAEDFTDLRWQWIPRHLNAEADALTH